MIEQIPSDPILDWSITFVNKPYDRPWFYTDPPLFAVDFYKPPCRCKKAVKLQQHPCEDDGGFMYLGQCELCETIVWSFKEK
jgi:hypothetical protein